MSAKTFLLQECKNVKDLLHQTLRYEYGLDGSLEFFEECATRLDFITSELSAANESDEKALTRNGTYLNDLAGLVCRIERSSLGEYSWPFVEELKGITAVICTESTLAGPNTPPKVYVLADGGLDTYAIYVEQRRPSASKRRILTIVFPKSLKHFVLLHSILGHEIGHAIWRCSKHQAALKSTVIAALIQPGSNLATKDKTADHIFSTSAPNGLKEYLLLLSNDLGINKASLFQWADWGAWIEEILCDLIGLITFGPSFVAAQCELLFSLDPSGVHFGDQHPPVAWRVNLVIRGAKILGYDAIPATTRTISSSLTRFWQYIDSFRNNGAWFDVIDDTILRTALTGIRDLLAVHPPSGYTVAPFDQLESLLSKVIQGVPPIGFSLNGHGDPDCTSVDFRHILFAGWIASRHDQALPFDLINKLCEHAIMQQRAITIFQKGGA
jgi:hypothetical protein